jgi:2-dehydro-3-deoxygluconokinase
MNADVLTLGEAMVALRADGLIRLGASMTTSIAGAESNVAIALSRLGHHASWVGRVGGDQTGALVLRTLRAEGVDIDHVVQDRDAETGLILFEQRLPDVTRVEYHRRSSAGSRLTETDVGPALALGAKILHVTGVTLAVSTTARRAVMQAVDTARAAGSVVCLDVNFRSRLWSARDAAAVLRPLAERCDIVIASQDELPLVADSPAELLGRGPREVVVKQGADGAHGYSRDGEAQVPAHRVEVVSSIGAGDAFCAGYLSAHLDGQDLNGRLARANALGAFAVSHAGDWEGLPTREELALLTAATGTALR